MVGFEEERIEVQNDDNIESYVSCLLFCIDKSINEALNLYLNSSFGKQTYWKDFESYENFPKVEGGDFFIISKVLSDGIPKEVNWYFEQAWSVYKQDILINRDFNIDTLRLKFLDTDYLTYAEAVESICNAFLVLLPSKKILEFSKELIFTCSYDALPFEFFSQKSSVNYTALVYLIQKDLTLLDFSDITRIKKDLFNRLIQFNPFFDTQSEIINKIKKIFHQLGKIKLNDTKTGTKDEKFKRIYDIYLMTAYPNIYFMPNDKEKLTNREIYTELLKLGYSYGEEYDNESMDASRYHNQIKRELKLIDDLKKIEIPFDKPTLNFRRND